MPSGVAGSNPALPTICRSPSAGGGAVWKTVGRRKTGLQVRVLSAALSYWRRVLIGRQPVPNTGDPKGFGGSKSPFPLRSAHNRRPPDVVRPPPSSLISRFGRIGKCTCLLSSGRLIRHPGSGPGSGAHPGSNWLSWFFLKTCNKALKLYYEYNDKAFKRCYSGCQKK